MYGLKQQQKNESCICRPCFGSVLLAASVYGPDQHANGLHGVETAAVVGPEDPVLEFAAVHSSGVPDTVKVSLATSVVPPASFMEMGTVTW